MEAKASVKYIRIGPQKVRNILDLVRQKHVDDAFDVLANMNKKGARFAEDLLKSAVANAKVKKMIEGQLFIDDIRADGGPIMKRFMSRSMGRADRLLKRTSHLSVRLVEKPKSLDSAIAADIDTDAIKGPEKKKPFKKAKSKKEPALKKTAAATKKAVKKK
jgi:large subunit ribosomal protein L22